MKARQISEDNELRSSYRTRMGAAIVTVCFVTAASTVLFVNVPVLRKHLAMGMILLGVTGLILLLLRRRHASEASAEQVLLFYQSPRYWGTTVLISTWLTLVLVLFFSPGAIAVPKFFASKPPPPQTDELGFPPLKVTAVILRGDRSCAVIDNETVLLGQTIDGVTVVEIFEDGIIVEKEGQRKTVLRAAIQPLEYTQATSSAGGR